MKSTLKKNRRRAEPTPVCPPTGLTLQRSPLFQIKDEDPERPDLLELLLGPDDVRVTTYSEDSKSWLTIYMTPADFTLFVEQGQAHSFTSDAGLDWTFREDPVLLINDRSAALGHYLEIVLRPDGVSFSTTACDQAGICYCQIVRITAANFKLLIDRCRFHRFGG